MYLMNRCSGGGEKQTKSATEPSLVNCSPDGGVTTKFVVDCGKARNQSVGNWMSKKQRWGRWSRGEVIKSWAGPLQENVWLGDAAETCEIVVFSSVFLLLFTKELFKMHKIYAVTSRRFHAYTRTIHQTFSDSKLFVNRVNKDCFNDGP